MENTDKKFYILNTESLPIPGNFWHTINKFASGFTELGFEVLVVKKDSDLNNIQDSFGNFFFVGNHGFQFSQHPESINNLKKFPQTTKILWFFHDFISKNRNIDLGRWILTGEHF